MRCGLSIGLIFLLAIGAAAHRLDEYLQAARFAVAVDRIGLSLRLTPGVAVARQLLDQIDLDSDERVSDDEAAGYARRVLKDLRVHLNGRALDLQLESVIFPSVAGVKQGEGVIRVEAAAPVDRLAAGDHALNFTNAHLPEISVYLVNALVPKSPAVRIQRQVRDEVQRSYCLEFGVAP